MTTLAWLPKALNDLKRLQAFVEKEQPYAALEAARRIKEAAMFLTGFPEAGTRVEDSHYREFPVSFGRGAYIVRYHYQQRFDRVVITNIWHSRELRH